VTGHGLEINHLPQGQPRQAYRLHDKKLLLNDRKEVFAFIAPPGQFPTDH